ncbi:MAG: hypothetical protein QOG85_1323 [Gaiellaceae bacterium]|jgi:hypothetical protein|nr:hypothetical protein [Gaiellaceae bacterium]
MSSEESHGTSRGQFLKRAAGATVVVAGAGVGAGAFAPQAAASSSLTSSRFSLELDGINVGRLAGADGGGLEYDVVLDPPSSTGGDGVQNKHIGGVKYEDFTIRIGSNMDAAMYDWIKNSFDKGYTTKNGALIAGDFNYNEVRRIEFTDAFITEVTSPPLSALASPGYFTVKFSPTLVTDVAPSGAPVQAAKHKAWLCSSFRLIVQGVDTTRLASVDSFTWKQRISPADSTHDISVGDLGVTFDQASLPSWQRWYDNFAVGGDATDERSGVVELVGANGGGVLNLGLTGLGLYQLRKTRGLSSGASGQTRAAVYARKGHWDLAVAK